MSHDRPCSMPAMVFRTCPPHAKRICCSRRRAMVGIESNGSLFDLHFCPRSDHILRTGRRTIHCIRGLAIDSCNNQRNLVSTQHRILSYSVSDITSLSEGKTTVKRLAEESAQKAPR